MIAIIASILVAISILLSVLLSFAPNLRSATENDLMRTVKDNAYLAAYQSALIDIRTGNLYYQGDITKYNFGVNQKMVPGTGDVDKDTINATVKLNEDAQITANAAERPTVTITLTR